MSREIKFRAWSPYKKEFIKDGKYDTLMIQLEGGDVYRVHDDSASSSATSLDDIVLQQFTGLKDNKGREVYDGDIINVVFSAYVPNVRHEIKWSHRYVGFYGDMIEINPHSAYHQERAYQLHELGNYEIIGNIHEHPHLLTEPQ